MTMHDRQYQVEAVQSIWNYFSQHQGHPVLAMPTGTGKSVVIARFLQSVFGYYPNQKVMVLTHVKELIKQNYEKLLAVWPFAPVGVYSAGLNSRDTSKPIIFGGIASVAKKAALFGHVDLVIIDEAHLVSPNDATMYQKFIADLMAKNPYLKVIGLTATPWRLGHGHITDPTVVKGEETPSLFTDVCFDITGLEAFNRLIAEGFLCPLSPKPTRTVLDLDGVHMRGGEFVEAELQFAVDKEEITFSALREALEVAADRKKWLIFASGVDHAEHIASAMELLGETCLPVHSKMPSAQRDESISRFKRGEVRAVVNNNVLTTGFDDPGIDLILCLRPTASAVLWVQMLGRGTRPLYAPGFELTELTGRLAAITAGEKRNCLVLDYAGNTRRLGPINDPVRPRRKGEKGGTAPVKLCEVCNTWNHASVRFCTNILPTGEVCNHEFVFQTKLKADASTAALIKGDLPVVEVFKVDQITYSEHRKIDKPPMVKVTYYSGLNAFTEYVCVEHTNFAGKKARDWWRLRTSDPMPSTTAEALEVADQLPPPTHLRVWTNKQYPEILATDFTGTAFGTEEASGELPEVGTQALRKAVTWDNDLDDDVPF